MSDERIAEKLLDAGENPQPMRNAQGHRDGYGWDLGGEARDEDIGRYGRILWAGRSLIAVATFLGVVIGLLSTLSMTPMYRARTSLEIQALNDNFLNIQSYSPTVAATAVTRDADARTQIEILKSESLLRRVAEKLASGSQDSSIAVAHEAPTWGTYLGLLTRAEPSERVRAVSLASGNLEVRLAGATRIIEATTSSTDPNVAADFLNVLAAEYITQHAETHWETTQRTGQFLSRQLDDLKDKLERAEGRLRSYAVAEGLFFVSDDYSAAEARFKHLQEELAKVQVDRIAKQSRFETAARGDPDRLAEIVSDGLLSQYQAQLTELRRSKAELTATLTEKHPDVIRVTAQIQEVSAALGRESDVVLERIRDEFETIRRREDLLLEDYSAQSAVVSEQGAKLSHYRMLKHEVDTTRELYDTLLQRVKEGGVVAAMRASSIRVVDPARPAANPYRPNGVHNALLGAIFGLFAGVVLVSIRELTNQKIHAPGEVESYTRTRELGVIPASLLIREGRLIHQLPTAALSVDDKAGVSPTRRTARTARRSLLAESFRDTLASMIATKLEDGRPQVIVLTSPNPSEGKTTVASNLAAALAEIGDSVLLIDADLRNPQIHQIFDVSNRWGLSDLLMNADAEAKRPPAGIATGYHSLHLLPAGQSALGSSSVFHSDRLAALVRDLRLQYKTILIDTPPMLHLPDARILARVADGVILVVRAGETGVDTIVSVSRRLTEDGTPILGTVLNSWQPSAMAGYGYGPWFRYYKRYRLNDLDGSPRQH